MRWEEGKKWQKKLDVLRNKLAEKTGEVEAALKQISSLKEMQNRFVYVQTITSKRALDYGQRTGH